MHNCPVCEITRCWSLFVATHAACVAIDALVVDGIGFGTYCLVWDSLPVVGEA